MKKSKKSILIVILTLMILPLFLIPRTSVAQEWTYDGVNTERIPNYSVYPSEWYKANFTGVGISPENYTIFEIIKGNITDYYAPFDQDTTVNGTSVYVNAWMVNSISGEISLIGNTPEFQLCWYNASVGYISTMVGIIPVDETGKVTAQILQNVTFIINAGFEDEDITFEHNAIYPNHYSFAFWNSSYNNAYFRANYTDDGICTKLEHTCLDLSVPNVTIMSQPAQESPDFDITTEYDTLTVNSTEFKLNITITDADNNNDGEIDTDYLYRIQNGTEWSDWATIPNLLDWDLGDVEEGSYTVTIEVKNMYGVTQEEIIIEYVPPKDGDGGIIPGYPLFLVLSLFTIITSIIIKKKVKKATKYKI